MGKQIISRKRGFSGTSRNDDSDKCRRGRKNRRKQVEEEIPPSPTSSNSGNSSEEVPEEEVVIHREPSMYDNLLKTLASGSESIANANRRRQRAEEGKSDSDEDDDSKFVSDFVEDEDEDEEEDEDGSGDDSPSSALEQGDAEGSSLLGNTKHSEDDESDDGDEASEVDEEEKLKTNGQSTESASTSSFNDHLGYKLSKEEVEILSKKRWKYKWEVPGPAISNCKWMATREFLAEDGDMNSGYGLKLKLFDHWVEKYKASGGSDFHSSKQRSFFSLCNSYQDILHPNKKPFYLKGREEDSSIMDAYIMHSLNHVFKTRDLVSKNDTKLVKLQETTKDANLNSHSFLDRGFTRPKVLILLPIASIAFRVVKRLIELTPSAHKVTVEHLGRFSEEFGTGVSNDQEDAEDAGSSKSQRTSKPSDFQALFGGNNNDHFMIGIKLTRKSIRLFGDFYSSDVIVASPLGLITKIGEAEAEKEKDVDYLSSIEVLIIDHADVIAMQNWSHVNTVVEQLNRIPAKQHGTDIMRVRHWHLDGQAQFYRQSIILGSHVNPDINALFNNNCLNYRGKVKLLCEHKGVLPKVLLNVGQVYERFDAEAIVDVDDARLEYFSKKVFPKIKEESIQGGVLLFISSYFEFVRVRNFLKSQDASFCLLGEYTKQSDISRARVWFFQGSRKIMLYTERAHFYHRYKIRGIKKLIMYSLPERKEFYPEILNMLEGGSNEDMSCRVLFSRFDQLRLERIVGSATAKRMVTSDKGVFTFQ